MNRATTGEPVPTRAQQAIERAQDGALLGSVYPAGGSMRRPRGAARQAASLTVAEREQVIDTFLVLIEGLYTHLPLKRARYAVDPLQRLRLLRQRVAVIDDAELHHQLAAIMTGLRDAHTRYIGPASLEGRAAMLPFLVESYGPASKPRYIVSKVASRASLIGDPHFVRGVELRWWNAVPVDRAVDIYAEQETGGRPDSRRGRALQSLTVRALQYQPPPDEHWVDVGYVDLDGKEREVRIHWRVVQPGRARTAARPDERTARAYGIDHAAETARRVKKMLFAPGLWYAERATARPPSDPGEWIPTRFQDTVAAKTVTTPSGRFGYLRLWSFDLADDVAYVREIMRLLALLPDTGLIIDLRSNPGGLIWAAERMLQLFTPNPVRPTKFSMVATAVTRAMADAPQNAGELAEWRESLHDAVSTGELYSRTAPITSFEQANDIGQVYSGPVVAVVDANTYSAGDLFAAGFYDNDIGTLVTIGDATGGGGANVWEPGDVDAALLSTEFSRPKLPSGISYTLAIRRATRTGVADGIAIEDIGVAGHTQYAMTRRDLTEDNPDLRAFCGRILAEQPRTAMDVRRRGGRPPRFHVTTRGLDRLEVAVDGIHRPLALDGGEADVVLTPEWNTMEITGYAQQQLRQRRLVRRQ